MCALEGGKSAFERRSEQAMRRRKVPTETSDAIPLKDQSEKQPLLEHKPAETEAPQQMAEGQTQQTEQQQEAAEEQGQTAEQQTPSPEQQPEAAEENAAPEREAEAKQYITVMPDEIPGADETHYIVDDKADPNAAGTISYGGRLLRPLSDVENNELSAIMSDRKLMKEQGPKRLSSLRSQGTPAAPEVQPAPRTKRTRAPEAAKPADVMRDAPKMERGDFEAKDRTTETGRGGAGAPPEPPPQGPAAGPERDGHLEPHKIFAGERESENAAGRERVSLTRTDDWKLKESSYIGVNVVSVQEILARPENEHGFGQILEAMNPRKMKEAMARYHEGKLTKDDRDFLTLGAHEYSKWSQKAEKFIKELTPADVELFGRQNQDMRNLTTFLKKGGAMEVTKKLVMHLAMKDQQAMQDMEDAFRDLKRARGTARYRRTEMNVLNLSHRIGIDPKDFGPMFDLKNPQHRAETEMRVAKHIHERAGGLRRAIDWLDKGLSGTGVPIPGSSRDAAMRTVKEAYRIAPNMRSWSSPTSWVLDTADKSLHTIATRLGEVAGSDEIGNMLAREALTNAKQAMPGEAGPRSFAEMRNLEKSSKYSEASIDQRVGEYMETNEYKNARSPEAALSNFVRQETEGGGFFAWLFRVLFGKRVEKAAAKKLNREVHLH